MIVLHCTYKNKILSLWAEKAPDSPLEQSSRRGKELEKPIPQPHPYDAGWDGLKAALSSFDSGLKILKRDTETACLWLPSQGGVPAPSSPLIAEALVSTLDVVVLQVRRDRPAQRRLPEEDHPA